MKILLLGRNGQVGVELQRSLVSLGELVALERRSQDYCGDLTNLAGLGRTISNIRPDVIVNAAAYTAVDGAETDEKLARQINSLAPAYIANAAKEIGALLIHYSTDYVFSGDGEKAWQESDSASPVNLYGHSKLAGENAIAASGCQYLIFRTSWVYSAHGSNFLKTILTLGRARSELKIINDQHGAPTGAELIANVTAHCVRHFAPEKTGIYHLVASGFTTWYGYAQYIFSIARKQNIKLLVTADSVLPVMSEEYKVAARRPLNSKLNCKKICDEFSIDLPDWRLGVESVMLKIIGDENEKT